MATRTPRQLAGIDDEFEDVTDLEDEDDLGIGDDDVESEEPDDDEADHEAASFSHVQEYAVRTGSAPS